MTALTDRLAEAKGSDSIDVIADRATKAGYPIDRSVVSRYLNGKGAKRPPEETLLGLAHGFKIDIRELRRLARVPAGELGPYKPPAVAARLNEDQRKALDRLIVTIVDQKEGTDDGTQASPKKIDGPDDGTAGGLAAVSNPPPADDLALAEAEEMPEAARAGKPASRVKRDQEWEEATEPDPEGPEFGA